MHSWHSCGADGKLWVPHPWKCRRPGWMGLWAAWSSGICPCPWQGGLSRWSLRSFPYKPNFHSWAVVLGMPICSETPLGYSKRAGGAAVLPTWCPAGDTACAGQPQSLGETAACASVPALALGADSLCPAHAVAPWACYKHSWAGLGKSTSYGKQDTVIYWVGYS